ncbi:hypothetical protein BHE74_00043426 [Ensete ventricosum]|nr:hypothetical protein GW17_00041101 [Ensete ventricosum]RWW50330.1 hypothetical protein BHE74_00043426 [Ensete ventricosum]RZS16674.1 hypothetical protein BHM03_00048707 [Ensete ventricosum]
MQHLYLGRNPPVFTDARVLRQSSDDDHLVCLLFVLELGLNFLSADDMSAKLAVQLRKRLGFGITANMHITGMHVEGKVQRFISCSESNTALEQISDKLLDVAFGQTLVEVSKLVLHS